MTTTERDMVKELAEICKLVVSAAAKHTIASHGVDAMRFGQQGTKISSKAVGRLHNAARRARAILPADIVAEIEAAAADGVRKDGC